MAACTDHDLVVTQMMCTIDRDMEGCLVPLTMCAYVGREPGRVHCMSIPSMVRTVGFSYSKSCSGAVPRGDDGNNITYVNEEEVPRLEVTQAEKGLFSKYVQREPTSLVAFCSFTFHGPMRVLLMLTSKGPVVLSTSGQVLAEEAAAKQAAQAVAPEPLNNLKYPSNPSHPSRYTHEQPHNKCHTHLYQHTALRTDPLLCIACCGG